MGVGFGGQHRELFLAFEDFDAWEVLIRQLSGDGAEVDLGGGDDWDVEDLSGLRETGRVPDHSGEVVQVLLELRLDVALKEHCRRRAQARNSGSTCLHFKY